MIRGTVEEHWKVKRESVNSELSNMHYCLFFIYCLLFIILDSLFLILEYYKIYDFF
jgi:hypothetical protein